MENPLNAAQPGEGATGPLSRPALGEPRRDQPGEALGVIEGNHPVIQTHRQVRDGKLVIPGPGAAFEVVAQVVAEQSSSPALERREAEVRFHGERSQVSGEDGEGVAALFSKPPGSSAGGRTEAQSGAM